jgi:hypothetical protein
VVVQVGQANPALGSYESSGPPMGAYEPNEYGGGTY